MPRMGWVALGLRLEAEGKKFRPMQRRRELQVGSQTQRKSYKDRSDSTNAGE